MIKIVFRLWAMGIQASVLICIVLTVRALLKKYPKIYSYCLWSLVGVRLLCPVWIESPLSLSPNLSIANYQESPKRTAVLHKEDKKKQTKPQPEAAGQIEIQQIQKSETAAKQPDKSDAAPKRNEGWPAKRITLFTDREMFGAIGISQMLAVFYLIVTICFAAFYAIEYLWMKHKLSTAVHEKENIWLVQKINSPFVMGILAPKIYLPYSNASDRFFYDSAFIDNLGDISISKYSSAERTCILEHEFTHIRHHDPLIRMAGIACICLHWWNPLVWLAVFKMNEDMEMFCDETVLKTASLGKRAEYANALLSFAVKESGFWAGVAFGESNTEKRIKNIRYKRKKNWLVSCLTAFLILFCAAALLTVPQSAVQSQEKTQEESYLMLDARKEETSNRLAEDRNNINTTEAIEHTRTEGLKSEQTTPFAYAEYTGFLDACREWDGYAAFIGQDYDGDGQTDRVFRTYQEKSDLCHYQIMFGNQTVLDFEKDVYANGEPTIKAADINGDGNNEMILLLQYPTSTDMRAFGDIAVFEKNGDAYTKALLPFTESEQGYSLTAKVRYQKKKEQLITVSLDESLSKKTDTRLDVPIPDWLWEEAQYKDYFADTSSEDTIWDLFFVEDGQKVKLACKVHLFDKWSPYGLILLMGYENGEYVVEKVLPASDEFSDSLPDTTYTWG